MTGVPSILSRHQRWGSVCRLQVSIIRTTCGWEWVLIVKYKYSHTTRIKKEQPVFEISYKPILIDHDVVNLFGSWDRSYMSFTLLQTTFLKLRCVHVPSNPPFEHISGRCRSLRHIWKLGFTVLCRANRVESSELCLIMRTSMCVEKAISRRKVVHRGKSRVAQSEVVHRWLQDKHILRNL